MLSSARWELGPTSCLCKTPPMCMYIVFLRRTVLAFNLTAFSDPPNGTTIQPVLPVVIGLSVDLVCTATGDPPINFTWVFMGEENATLNDDPTSGNFTLPITQVNQYGVYICITTNNLGTDATSVDIIQASKSTMSESLLSI